MAAAPVIVGSTVRAALFVGSREALRLGDRVLTAVTEAARDLEQFLASHEHAHRLLTEVRSGRTTASSHDTAALAQVHEVHTELLELTATIDETHLKERFHDVHVWLSYALYALAGLHVAAALKHQFVDKDGLILRMLPGGKP